ncbi:MAG: CHAD domain-containing protein [Candidatus Methanoliparum thermophilum]|uniref:CHAD domain-containing protein n=1 Tax=Methanoliparum thermophilum TaxID=2491083 RepID=A0A520KRY8_METT2|nr:MAG: CHAD domain-containing protein [Candidatus Methanoliparum thermophilum]
MSYIIKQMFEDRVDLFFKRLEETKKEITADSLHNLRVATRRLNAVLTLVSSLSNKKIKIKDLKILMRSTSDLRDFHVQLQLLNKIRDDESYDFIKICEEIINREIGRREVIVFQEIRDFPISKIKKKLKDVTVPKDNKDMVLNILAELFEDFYSYKDDAINGDDFFLHKMRIALKRLRYTAEIIDPLFPFINKDILGKMQQLQQLMGDIHDINVLKNFMEQINIPSELDKYREKCIDKLLSRKDELFNIFFESVGDIIEFGKLFSVKLFEKEIFNEKFYKLVDNLDNKNKIVESLRYAECVHIAHPLRTSLIISNELAIKNEDLIIAALLHDTLEQKGTIATMDEIMDKFGKQVADLVWSVTRETTDDRESYIEKIKMIGKDAIILKLSDRLDSTRYIDSKSNGDRRKYWKITIEDFLPLGKTLDKDIFYFFYNEYKKLWDNSSKDIKEGLVFPNIELFCT